MTGIHVPDGYLPPTLKAPAREAFARARLEFHRTVFERTAIMFQAPVDGWRASAIVAGYRSFLQRLLFHDPAPMLEVVDQLVADADPAERAIALSLAASARADHDAARSNILEFLGGHVDDPYARHLHGIALFDLGRHAEAVVVLDELLADQPAFNPARNHLGAALIALGRSDEGVATLRDYVSRDPDNPSARDSLADALETRGELSAAIAELEIAVELEADFAYGWLHLGDLRARMGDQASAQRAYRSALDRATHYGQAFRDRVSERVTGQGLAASREGSGS
ncbi:MAG: tetratricopeptide repeat protein [Chloroflexi bacterium]|nr:tetratricopeptide repeat protein [Chloroflexota bacterium]